MKKSPRVSKSGTSKSITDYKLKPWMFPEGFVLLQDTREQLPLFTRIPNGLIICSTNLTDGDYSIKGFQHEFAIERKQISDLLSYCTIEREKTKAKMARFKSMEWTGLIVESSEHELYRPYLYSKVSPELIRQCLVSFSVRYGVHVYINNRENISRWLLDHAIKYYKIKHELA